MAQAAATAHCRERIFALDRVSHFAAAARPSSSGELAIENERGNETLAFALVERVSIIGIKLLNLDIVVGRQLLRSARFGSSRRTERGQRSQQHSCRKKTASQHESPPHFMARNYPSVARIERERNPGPVRRQR